MKNFLIAATLLVTGLMSSAQAQEGKQNFTLVNKTGYTFSEIYVSPSKANDWEEDILGDDELDDGETFDVSFSRSTKTCKWDLKVVYSDDDSSAVWKDIDLCAVSKVTLRYNRSSDTTSATFD
jgi:hypothetical protein